MEQMHSTKSNEVAESGDVEISLRQAVELLLATKWTILAISLLGLALGIGYLIKTPSVYQADGLVQVDTDSKTSGITALSELSAGLMGGGQKTEAEIQLLQSRMVLDQVAERMHMLVQTAPRRVPLLGTAFARLNQHRQTPAPAFLWLNRFAWGGENILVSTFEVPDSVLSMQFTLKATEHGYTLFDPDGKKLLEGRIGQMESAPLAEGKVNIFVREMLARSGTEFLLVRASPLDTWKQIKGSLTISEKGKQSGILELVYRGGSQQQVVDVVNSIEDAYLRQNVERRSAEAEQSLTFLQDQLPEMKKKVEAAQANLNDYQIKNGTVDVTQETAQVLEEGVNLATKRLELQQQRQEALQRFTPEHPVIKGLDQQIQLIQAAEDKTKGNTQKLPQTQQEVYSLLRDLDVQTELYTSVLDSIQQLNVAKAGTVGNVRIVDRPQRPTRPIAPRRSLVLTIALLGGFFFGVTYVVLQRALLRGVDDPAEVERLFGLLTFGAIPFSNTQWRFGKLLATDNAHRNLILANGTEDEAVSEALRSLRTSLHFALVDAPNNVVMLTGPSPGLGKTFVSVNLGALLAMTGKKVVIVDTDMRRGYIHRYFGREAIPGLSGYVAGDCDIQALIRPTGIAGFDFIARGEVPPNPAELLLSERFSALITHLSRDYDFVLIDSPPVLAVSDAAIVGRIAGSTLLVLKSAEHPIREIDETLKRLSNARISVRGVVFNQVGRKLGSYGYGNYGYASYKYDSE